MSGREGHGWEPKQASQSISTVDTLKNNRSIKVNWVNIAWQSGTASQDKGLVTLKQHVDWCEWMYFYPCLTHSHVLSKTLWLGQRMVLWPIRSQSQFSYSHSTSWHLMQVVFFSSSYFGHIMQSPASLCQSIMLQKVDRKKDDDQQQGRWTWVQQQWV